MTVFDDDFLKRLETLRLAFARRATVEREGDHTRRRAGGSPEFDAHRPYSPGDDPARIDWNAYARLGELFVKQFERPSTQALQIAIDTSPSMAGKLDQTRRIAAALVFVGAAGYARVELGGAVVTPSDAIRRLEALTPTGGPPTFPERSCAVAVLSDFWIDDADFFRKAALFRARGGELSLIHLLTRAEVDPALAGSLQLVDSETGERKKLYVGPPEREQYVRAVRGYCESLRERAASVGAPYVLVCDDEPMEAILFDRLRAAGVLE